jgi:hypothetical protein
MPLIDSIVGDGADVAKGAFRAWAAEVEGLLGLDGGPPTLAAGATIDIAAGTASDAFVVFVGGTTGPCTSFGTGGLADGRAARRLLCFTATGLAITHSAALVLPNGTSLVMRAGDAMLVQRVPAGWQALIVWRGSGVDLGATAADFTNRVVGRGYAEYLANADLATIIPRDDTVPQATEGTQILALTHTPQAAANRMRLSCWGFSAQASGYPTFALFRDGVCVQVGRATSSGSAWEVPIGFDYEEAAGTISAISYTVRAGASSGAMRLNGTTGGRLYGGAARTTLVLTELRP